MKLSSVGELVDLLPWSVDLTIGQSSRAAVESELGPALDDPRISAYVARVGQRLVPYSEHSELPYTFTVLDNDMVNAFALPGGSIYVTSGLLRVLGNEAQLASVLGHEMGHVTDRHGVKQLGVGAGASILASAALGDRLSDEKVEVLSGMLLGLLSSGYSRHHEEKADAIGLETAVKAGYHPMGAVQVMEIFDEIDGEAPNIVESWFMTHPPSGERVDNLMHRVLSRYPQTGFVGEEEYLAEVEGKLPEPKLDVWNIGWLVMAGASLAGLWWLYRYLSKRSA